jgi:hypothetical protein
MDDDEPSLGDPADALLPPLTERLEAASDLVTRADATAHFQEIVRLCREAITIAGAGMLVADRSSLG